MKETELSILKETKYVMVILPVIECMGHEAQREGNLHRQKCKTSTATDSRSKHELPLANHILL